jgi:predicted secreted hydrolase
MKVRTKVKSGSLSYNHNQTRLKIRSGIKAGGLAALSLLLVAAACSTAPSPEPTSIASATLSAGGDNRSCPQGLSGPINLPQDDAAHAYSAYSDEWWYYSSHLETDDGLQFGFAQIFYTLLDPSSSSPIQYEDAVVADEAKGTFHFGGRQFNLSPVTILPNAFSLAVGTDTAQGGDGHDVVHSEVSDGTSTYVIDLTLTSEKTPVLHLADGYVMYYSRERMRAEGTIVIDGTKHYVHGTTWFDHQFGPQLVELSTVQNWTWIAVQLSGRRELLALVVNKQDGTQEFIGSYTDADCGTTQLGAGDFVQTTLGSWAASPTCTYPFGWRVQVPSKGLDLKVVPVIQNQDIWVPGLDHYYEGTSSVTGSDEGKAYVELFGFCAP